MSKRDLTSRILGCGFVLLVIVSYFASLDLGPKPKKDLRWDEELSGPLEKSTNLTLDIERMWKTVPGDGFAVSPVSAIKAANRVFRTIDLVGMHTNQVIRLIGHNKKSNNSGYNFPFHPVESGTLVYRFDSGFFGSQFNLKTDGEGKVIELETQGIE